MKDYRYCETDEFEKNDYGYETDEFWEDNDNQDGTYFGDYEMLHRKVYNFENHINEIYEEKKYRALLYIRAHFDELMNDEAYRTAYYKLIDDSARSFSCLIYEKYLTTVSDEQRELEGAMLDFEIYVRGEKKIEKYKADAAYIVNSIFSGRFDAKMSAAARI